MDEVEYLDGLVAGAEETERFHSNPGRRERERSVCRALLRCLQIECENAEIVSPAEDPPDVLFRSAGFEVLWIFEQGRTPHREARMETERRRRAKSMEEGGLESLASSYHPPALVAFGPVIALVTKRLRPKSQKYAPSVRAQLDVVAYVDIESRVLDPKSPFPSITDLRAQGWRSVSLLMPWYAHVIYAEDSAPEFLRYRAGRTAHTLTHFHDLFD